MKQIVLMIALGIRSIPDRLASSFVIIIAITSVVAVLLSVLAMAGGFSQIFDDVGRPDRAMVLLKGATSEAASGLSRDAVQKIINAREIKAMDGNALASPEVLQFVGIPRGANGNLVHVTVRGVTPIASEVRPEMHIIQGRMFKSGLQEIIVGKSAHAQFSALEIGRQVSMRGANWTIVGIFESSNQSHQSELVADAESLMVAFRQSFFQSVNVLLHSPADFQSFKDSLTTDLSLTVDVWREPDYFRQQSGQLKSIMYFVAYVVGGLMSIGAMAGAVNTMYAAVSGRSKEIATLRAIGFNSSGIVVSVLMESLLLALLGAVIGASLSWVFFSGTSLSTVSSASQVVFSMKFSPGLLFLGVSWGLVIGFVGGLLPALRAARMPVAQVLRGL